MVLKNTLSKVTLLSSAVALLALAACGPAPTQQSAVGKSTVRAIAISEVSATGDVKPSIGLSWQNIPLSAKSVTVFRRKDGESTSNAVQIAIHKDMLKSTLTDKDNRLEPGVSYLYNLRADDEKSSRVAAGESLPVTVIGSSDTKAFKMTIPAQNDEVLKDLGTGIEFRWEDAGTELYYIAVKNLSEGIQWAALTKKNQINFGAESEVAVPDALTELLPISKTAPDTRRNEVKFEGIGKGGTYKVIVKAIQTKPDLGNVMGATAIAIRSASEVTFITQ